MKSFLHVLISNLLIVILGVIQSFILPKLLGPVEYGKWSLYLLYIGYAGLFSFGFCDGIYLKYGGVDYDKLEHKKFCEYYYSHQIFTLTLLLLWGLLVVIFFNNKIFYLLIGITCFFSCNRDYFMAVNTATNRLKIFSFSQVIEKITILIGVFICWYFTDMRYAIFIILFALLGWLLTLIFNVISDRKIVFRIPCKLFNPLKDYKEFVLSGLCITLSSIGISLMTGIGKFGINIALGEEQLGYYSFVFSISALFLQFFNAVGTVFYPLFKNKNHTYTKSVMKNLDVLLTYMGLALLIMYYPMRLLLNVFFQQYKYSFDCLIVLIPMVIIQGKMGVIYNTMYKIWRMEKELLKNLFIGVVACLIITFVAICISKTIIAVAIATYVSLIFWNVITIVNFNNNQGEKWKYDIVEPLTFIIFLIINYFNGFTLRSFLISFIFIVIMMAIRLKHLIISIKAMMFDIKHKCNNVVNDPN